MTLTKEEAIRRHRMMWEWIANETLRRHECVNKIDAFRHFGWFSECISESWCWCCEYSNTMDASGSCDHCPIEWPSKSNFVKCVKYAEDKRQHYGLFSMWCRAVNRKDYRTAAYYALYISMLPERKD